MFSYFWPSAKPTARKYGWNYNEVLSEEENAKFAYKVMNYHPNLAAVKEIDNRSNLPPVKNQEDLGSCTANSICANFEYEMIKREKLHIPMSRLFLYYLERVREGTDVNQDSGAQIKDGIAICNDTGLCLESLWPYDTKKFAEKPPQNCYDDLQYHKAPKIHRVKKDLKDIDQCLLDGNVISMGFLVYESFERIGADGMCPIPDVKKEKLLGGHAVLLHSKLLINGKSYYAIQNSWSSDWGNNGMFYVEPEFLTMTFGTLGLQSLCSDFWTIQMVLDLPDSNVVETDAQKLEHVKQILGVDASCNELETLFDGVRNLVVKVESTKH